MFLETDHFLHAAVTAVSMKCQKWNCYVQFAGGMVVSHVVNSANARIRPRDTSTSKQPKETDQMSFGKNLLLASTILASTALPASAASTFVFASPTGNDSNSCMTVDAPCKTITRAVSLAQPGWIVEPAAGTYCENLKITKSGTPGHGQILIRPLNGPHAVVDASCSPNPSDHALEITGSYIYVVGNMGFTGSKGDGVYIHGTDAAHPTTSVHISQSLVFNNAGRNIVAIYTQLLDIGYGRSYNSGRESVVISSSPTWHVHDMNIYQVGPATAPLTGTKVTLSPHGNYEGNDGKENLAKPNLDLEKSPDTSVVNNAPGTGGVFTFTVTPQSDISTDTFSNNGSQS